MGTKPLIALMLATALLAPLSGRCAGVTVEHDRFTGVTSISGRATDSAVTDGPPVTQLLAVVAGDQKKVRLTFVLYGRRDWSDCTSTDWLVDGHQVEIHTAKYQPQMWSYDLDAAQLQQLATAKHIEYRLCNDEYTMSAADLALIAEFERVLSAQLIAVAQ